MSYTWVRFDADDGTSALLPTGLPQETIDTGEPLMEFDDGASGGALDTLGDEDAWPGTTTLSRRATLVAPTQADLRVALDALLAMSGKKGKLYRQVVGTNELQWTYGRMGRITAPYTPANIRHIEVDTPFTRISRSWFADMDAITITELVGEDDALARLGAEQDGVHSLTLLNPGNAPVLGWIIEVTAAPVGLTALTLNAGDAAWSWSGNLAAGQTLRIDCGGRDVTVLGGDAYYGWGGGGSGFVLDALLHRITDWLRIMPGQNTLTLTFTPDADHTITITPLSGAV